MTSGMFNGLVQLKELNLGTNAISVIPNGALVQLQLTKLYLYENNLLEIRPEDMEGLESLVELKVNDNRIEQIHPDGLSGLQKLKLLHLHNKPVQIL